MAKFDATVLRTSLSEEDEAKLKEAFGPHEDEAEEEENEVEDEAKAQ